MIYQEEQKIIELGAIVEIRIPNKKIQKYKTERGLRNYIQNSVWDFMDNGLKKIGEFDVIYTNGMDTALEDIHSDGSLCEINDFNYSAANLARKNKDKRTYRFFGGKIMSVIPQSTFVNDEEKFIGAFDKTPMDIKKYKGNEFYVTTSMYAEHKKRNSK